MVAGILGEPPKPCQLIFQFLIKSPRRIVNVASARRGRICSRFGSLKARDQNLECHRHLGGTGLGACIAHFIRVCGMATPAGGIGIGSSVRDGDNARSVTENVNVA